MLNRITRLPSTTSRITHLLPFADSQLFEQLTASGSQRQSSAIGGSGSRSEEPVQVNKHGSNIILFRHREETQSNPEQFSRKLRSVLNHQDSNQTIIAYVPNEITTRESGPIFDVLSSIPQAVDVVTYDEGVNPLTVTLAGNTAERAAVAA